MNLKKLVLMSLCAILVSGCATNNQKTQTREQFAQDRNYNEKIHCNIDRKSDLSKLLGKVNLDIKMLIDMAFENSPEVKRSWHIARAVEARRGQAQSVFYPTILLSGRMEKSESNLPGPNETKQRSQMTSYYPALEMHYSLFKFGGSSQSADAAKQALYAANFQFDRAMQKLVHDVQNAYFNFSSAEQNVAAQVHNLDDATAAYESAFRRHQSGMTKIQEYLQAKASKAQAEFELEQSLSAVESARAYLATVIGIKVSNEISVIHPTIPENIDNIGQSIADLMSQVVKTRPDIAAAYANVLSKKHQANSSKTNLLPEFVIGGSGNRKKYEHKNGTFDSFGIFAGVEWKIFDGFKNIYDILEAKENIKVAEQELRQAELGAQSEVWTCYFSFKSALKKLNAAKTSLFASQEAFNSISVSYNNGLCSFIDLLAAQSVLAKARQQLVISKNNLLISLSDLAYATGGLVGLDTRNIR